MKTNEVVVGKTYKIRHQNGVEAIVTVLDEDRASYIPECDRKLFLRDEKTRKGFHLYKRTFLERVIGEVSA